MRFDGSLIETNRLLKWVIVEQMISFTERRHGSDTILANSQVIIEGGAGQERPCGNKGTEPYSIR